MNYKYLIGTWLRISNLYLNEYINGKILFYPYPIQYIFRYIWLYKLKKKYSHKINIKNLENNSNSNSNSSSKNKYKSNSFKNKLKPYKDYIIMRYSDVQKSKLSSFKKKINSINYTKNIVFLKTDSKRFNKNISISFNNQNWNFKIKGLNGLLCTFKKNS